MRLSMRSGALRRLTAVAALAGAAAMPALAALAREQRLQQALQALMAQQYDRAEREFAILQSMDPDDFDATYLRLVTQQSRILDYESYTLEEAAFLAYADSVALILQNHLLRLRGADSLRCLFYLGNVYGGKSAMLAKNDKWLGAISTAFTSVSYLKSVVRQNPDFLAAYFGIGAYNYYVSKNLQWLPLFGDRRSQGIKEIEKATRAPPPFDVGAKNLLCWIAIESGDFARADSIARGVLAQMPKNTVFLRIRAVVAVGKGDWAAAAALGRELIAISQSRTPVNWSDVTCGYDVVVMSCAKQGAGDLARAAADEALSLQIPAASGKIPYVVKHLKAIKEFRDQGDRATRK